MVEYIAKPNYNVMAGGKMIRFNSLGYAYTNKQEVIVALDKMSDVTRTSVEEVMSEPTPTPKPKAKKK